MAIKRACKRPDCSFSFTANEENITFGHGELLADGTWEFPCLVCANAAREVMPRVINQTRSQLLQQGHNADAVEAYLESQGWLNNPVLPEPLSPVDCEEEAGLLLAVI